MSNPYRDLAHAFRRASREEARQASPPPRRAKVIDVAPLSVEDLHSNLVLDQGDDDVDVSQAVLDYDARIGIEIGDQIIVDQVGGDYVLRSVVSDKDVSS